MTWISTILIFMTLSSTSFAAGGHETYRQRDTSTTRDGSLVQKTIACAKSCTAPLAGAVTSVVSFMGFAGASCSAGVCPLVAATGAGGLFTATGLGAALTAFVSASGKACEEGLTFQCSAYIAIPALIGGVSGYLVVKGYDKAREWVLRQQEREPAAESEGPSSEDPSPEEPSNDVAQFVPEEQLGIKIDRYFSNSRSRF